MLGVGVSRKRKKHMPPVCIREPDISVSNGTEYVIDTGEWAVFGISSMSVSWQINGVTVASGPVIPKDMMTVGLVCVVHLNTHRGDVKRILTPTVTEGENAYPVDPPTTPIVDYSQFITLL